MNIMQLFNHQKILVCYTKSCYKNISKICTSTFIFHNLKNVKKIEKIHMDSEKSINSFEIEKVTSSFIEQLFFLAICKKLFGINIIMQNICF